MCKRISIVAALTVLSICAGEAVGAEVDEVRPDVSEIRPLLNFSTEDLVAQYTENSSNRVGEALQSPPHRKKALELLTRAYRAAADKPDKPDERAKAITALADLFPDEALELVIEAAAESSAQVRVAAVSALAWKGLHGDAALAALRKALQDSNPFVVHRALYYFEKNADPASADRLAELVRHPPEVTAAH